jgi:hypothetical protein
MDISSAQYYTDGIHSENFGIRTVINGKTFFVPLTPGNRYYDEIMRQVEAGTLTIAEAD